MSKARDKRKENRSLKQQEVGNVVSVPGNMFE